MNKLRQKTLSSLLEWLPNLQIIALSMIPMVFMLR